MPTSSLTRARTSTAHQRYVHELTNVYLEGGKIYDPSYALNRDFDVYEKIRRDPVIQHAFNYRKHLIAGRKWNVAPASDAKADIVAAGVVEQLLKRIFGFSQARFNLAEAVPRGSSWARARGRVQAVPIWDGQIRDWWIPEAVEDMNKLRVSAIAEEDDQGRKTRKLKIWSLKAAGGAGDWVDLEHPEWYIKHVYDDVEESLGFGRGLIDALYFIWWSKAIIWNEALGGAERWARGFLVAKIDGTIPASVNTGNSVLRTEFLDELERQQSRHIMAIDKRHDITVVNPSGEGHRIVESLLGYADNVIRTLVLGSNLPTSATEGGSFALAKVQENSTEALIAFDRESLGETLTRDLVRLVWNLNRVPLGQLGLGEAQMPRFEILSEKVEDPIKEAQIAATVLPFLDLPKADLYRKIGYPVPSPDDDVVQKQLPPSPQGFPGAPSPGGFGSTP